MAAVLTAIIFSLSCLDLLIMALASLWQGKTPMFSSLFQPQTELYQVYKVYKS